MKQPIDRAKNFLIHSDRDIAAFYVLKGDMSVHPKTICFHSQQAVEKILKAVLQSQGIDPTRTNTFDGYTKKYHLSYLHFSSF